MVTDFSFITFLSFSVGFAALGITIVIAHRQGKLTKEIHDSTEEQKKLLNDTRDFYASAFVGYFRLISESYQHVINLYYNKYEGKPMSQEKENVRTMLKEYYNNHLINGLPKIEAIELIKVFGREIADKHWTHTAKLTASMWQADTDHGMALMIHSYKEQIHKLKKLKDEFLPFCEETYRNQDSNYQENYKLIEDTFTSAIKPRREDFGQQVN